MTMTTQELVNHFTHIPSEDPLVEDDDYQFSLDESLSVQDASGYSGGFVVNEWLEDDQAMRSYPADKTLADAMRRCMVIYEAKQLKAKNDLENK